MSLQTHLFSLPLVVGVGLVGLSASIHAGCGEKEKTKKKKSARTHIQKGKKLFSRGKIDRALEEYRAACRAHPRSATAQNLLGMALRFKFYETGDRGYREKENEAFDTAVALKPKWIIARINLANTLWETGRRHDAVVQYKKALALDADHPDGPVIRQRIQDVEKNRNEPLEKPETRKKSKKENAK
jgi:tetratricopeptide (TPR) repeat protein